MASNIAIIFAGGSGARMGSGTPKQFLEINGKPIIIYTLEIFEEHPQIDAIYVACKEDFISKLRKMTERYQLEKVRGIVAGGDTGQDSIYNALIAAGKQYQDDDIVLIHDGVRPCISGETIDEALHCVERHGNAVTCTALVETPMISREGVTVDELPPRSSFYTAQAPQCFPIGEVIAAHEAVRKENPEYTGIIDTCTLMKTMGHEIAIVEGPRGNIKVTTPEDLYLFRAMLQYRETEDAFGLRREEVPTRLTK